MATALKGIEEEIEGLLGDGNTPVDLVTRGFKRGTVYKVNRRIVLNIAGSGKPDESGARRDSRVEDDPEVLELKTALRKAELQRQIEEITGPTSGESRLAELEEAVEGLKYAFVENHSDRQDLERRLKSSPLFDLRNHFKCKCGSEGFLEVEATCTNCYSTNRFGWRPKRS